MRRFTPDEIAQVCALRRAGVPWSDIGGAFRRNYNCYLQLAFRRKFKWPRPGDDANHCKVFTECCSDLWTVRACDTDRDWLVRDRMEETEARALARALNRNGGPLHYPEHAHTTEVIGDDD